MVKNPLANTGDWGSILGSGRSPGGGNGNPLQYSCWEPGGLYSQAAAAAKSLQSCPTLCDPIDGSPPGSLVPGILQARTLASGEPGVSGDFWGSQEPLLIAKGGSIPLLCLQGVPDLLHACLENPRDGRAWWAAVYGVTQSWTRF